MTEPCTLHSGLTAQYTSICNKLELIERSIERQFSWNEKQVEVAKSEMDRRMATTKIEIEFRLKEIELKLNPLLSNSQETKGSRRWVDHIVTVLIGVAVILVVWLMQHGIK